MTSTQENAVGTVEGAGTEEVTAASAAVTYPVAPGYRLNVRSGPSSRSSLVRQLPYGARIAIRCQRHGERVSGPYGTNDIWDCIAPGQYVSDSYVRTGSDGFVAPLCAN
ncbi:SH3 domain-containing protein [Streptomyces sp. NPDC017529]|uniref:SH3 domain-containing protein n=1 Tax=Streptomyces sp. NPDC017529 TaxID=3365000 RepID=UPI00378E846E